MTPSLPELLAIPLTVWAWGFGVLFAAAGLAFWAGIRHERGAAVRALRNAQRSLADLFGIATKRLDDAQQVCAMIEEFPARVLSDEQAYRLQRSQSRLVDTLARAFERKAAGGAADGRPRKELEAFAVTWTREPADAAGFPNRDAFDASLAALLEAGRNSETTSGLILTKIDRFDAIQSRFGAAPAERLAQKLGSVLCRAIRDADLVCRLREDTFVALLPNVADDEARRLAEAVRNSVRHYHFRAEEGGPEVLLTASFGYSPCEPFDNADLVLDRAGDALARSQRRGRNQLHLHDGRQLVACTT